MVVGMQNNSLRYERNQQTGGRRARKCIPCPQREEFITESARNGETTVGLRQKNRYIDEFVVFTNKKFGVAVVDGIQPEHISAYEKAVREEPYLKQSTKNTKTNRAKQWLK